MSAIGDVGLLSPVWAGSDAQRLTDDSAVAHALVRTESALLRALVVAEVLPPAAREVADLVDGTTVDVHRLAVEAVAGGNPVIPLVRMLRSTVADEFGMDAVDWVHYGATSQDIMDTALMLTAAGVIDGLSEELASINDRLIRLATANRAVPAVARTLNQQALPTTLGLRVAGWLTATCDGQRAMSRLSLPVSLGGPVGSAQSYGARGPAVLEAFAESLGLAVPVLSWHGRRTVVGRLAAALVEVGGACGKIAADVLTMSQDEVAEARESDGGPSSSMAHKANPVRSVLISSAARQLPALASVIGTSAMTEQERGAGAWHAEWQPLRTMLRLTGGAVALSAQLLAGLRFDPQALGRNLARLCNTLGKDEEWVSDQLTTADVWIDRAVNAARSRSSEGEGR